MNKKKFSISNKYLMLMLFLVDFVAITAVKAQPANDTIHSFLAIDAGVALFGGLGGFAGIEKGPYRASIAYYHFKSNPNFGGFDPSFELRVDYIWAANVSYFMNNRDAQGPYVRVIAQDKKQIVANLENGVKKSLFSNLIGAELGYQYPFYAGFYLTPRVGALYYIKSPQPGNKPVTIGGKYYDNDKHKIWDLYYTLDIGYSF